MATNFLLHSLQKSYNLFSTVADINLNIMRIMFTPAFDAISLNLEEKNSTKSLIYYFNHDTYNRDNHNLISSCCHSNRNNMLQDKVYLITNFDIIATVTAKKEEGLESAPSSGIDCFKALM